VKRPIVPLVIALAAMSAATATGSGSRLGNHPYHIVNLPSLGGVVSSGASIDNRGLVSGSSDLTGDQAQHAALWRGDEAVDLGTLGGPNSGVMWPVKNNSGLIVGIAQTAAIDPLGERWSCSAFFSAATAVGHQCLGFAWRDGTMTALPTLGGTNGFATAANTAGTIVGWAENGVHDSTCVAPQVLQFRAVAWQADDYSPLELPPLAGDTTSAATAINDRGDVVGISGICDRAVGRFSARHAVLWHDGQPTDLGRLGGVAWNTPMAIDQRGDVVGFANVGAGGGFSAHAFRWTRHGGIEDLGTLPGDTTSQALGVNDRGEVVGTSCDADFTCRAVVWQNGAIADLNELVERPPGEHLLAANDVNDAGMITGQALAADGTLVAFVASD
jgi:probable HAF family extracellular repeat protein